MCPDIAVPDPRSSSVPADARVVMTHEDIARALKRIAHEIVEAQRGASNLVLLGIPSRGVELAQRLAASIAEIEGAPIPSGALDITLHRDDLRRQPTRAPHPTQIPAGGIEGATVVLVDDVLYSGRTVRAALDALADYGRPQAVRLAVLVDRGHRQLPIRADHVGKNLPTSSAERVHVSLGETPASDYVAISGGER